MPKLTDKPIVAHFMLHSVLTGSPPNVALKRAFNDLGFVIEEYAPLAEHTAEQQPVEYGLRWVLKHIFSFRWRKYSVISCTSEDPIFVAGLIAFVWRKPLVFLADEIRAGAYRGNRPEYFKKICRWAMRRAVLTIVNDPVRIPLQREYAELHSATPIVVYPGCFDQPPTGDKAATKRKQWGVKQDQILLCFSGACNLSTGMDLAIGALDNNDRIHLVTQPLSVDEFTRFLIKQSRHADRIFMQEQRLTWQESWASAAAADIGVAFYRNPAPQFQLMGISSNRLCMFIAMGVPVIVNKQASFDFLHDYECGIQVETQEEFDHAVHTIEANLAQYKQNALRCAREHIDAPRSYELLATSIKEALS